MYETTVNREHFVHSNQDTRGILQDATAGRDPQLERAVQELLRDLPGK